MAHIFLFIIQLQFNSQSRALLDLGRSMLNVNRLTNADEIYSLGIEIGYWMTRHFFDTRYFRDNSVGA